MSQPRQLAAIMFTDIAGYTSLMGEDEQKALTLIAFPVRRIFGQRAWVESKNKD